MKILKFDVYIGVKSLKRRSPLLLAEVCPNFLIPHGENNVDGSDIQPQGIYFKSLYKLGTYFADWIDLVEDETVIRATIHLNTVSNKKMFTGNDIVKLLNLIQEQGDIAKIKSFSKINN